MFIPLSWTVLKRLGVPAVILKSFSGIMKLTVFVPPLTFRHVRQWQVAYVPSSELSSFVNCQRSYYSLWLSGELILEVSAKAGSGRHFGVDKWELWQLSDYAGLNCSYTNLSAIT